MKLSLGISPCPNDTFIFDHFIHDYKHANDLQFDVSLEDVQTLNEKALAEQYDVVKISMGVFPAIQHHYELLNAGGAMGKGVGPLLIQRASDPVLPIESTPIAIPGAHTTAHFLLMSAFPIVSRKIFMRYDEIEDFVLSGKGMGVIIHENRFTYAERGLCKRMDLGEQWENKTGSPVPLGGIAIRRSLPEQVKRNIETAICDSLKQSWENYPLLSDFVRNHAQEMHESVMRQHIDLYVTPYSMNWGDSGREAIRNMFAHIQSDTNSVLPVFLGESN
jgi:1,4-dihydroxy-6-naphthoate synthase